MSNNLNMAPIVPSPGEVVQIPDHGNFVWMLKKPEDPASGYWKKMDQREWINYASEN